MLFIWLLGEPNELWKWFRKKCIIHFPGIFKFSWYEQKSEKTDKRVKHVGLNPFISPRVNLQIHIMEKLVQYVHHQLTQKQ